MEPLKPRVLLLLLELQKGPSHAYALKERLVERTGGSVDLGPGTLYRTVRDLVESGWIREVDGDDSDERKRVYEITRPGLSALKHEVARLRQIVNEARDAHVI